MNQKIAKRFRSKIDTLRAWIDNREAELNSRVPNTGRRATKLGEASTALDNKRRLFYILEQLADKWEHDPASLGILNRVTTPAQVEDLFTYPQYSEPRFRIGTHPFVHLERKHPTLITQDMRDTVAYIQALASETDYGYMFGAITSELMLENILRMSKRIVDYLAANKVDKFHQQDFIFVQRPERFKHQFAIGIQSQADKDIFRELLFDMETIKYRPVNPITDKLERSRLCRIGITGFYPTTVDVIDQMIELAHIEDGMKVLDPSCGFGSILDRVLEVLPTAKTYGVEQSPYLVEYIKKYRTDHCVNQGDIFQTVPFPADVVLMNPPFEDNGCAKHVQHVYAHFLKRGGVLVSVVDKGVFSRNDNESRNFRVWLDHVEAQWEDLDEDAFKDSERPVGVRTALIIIHKWV